MAERKRRREIKERILDEACRIFAEKGYRDATHAEICRAANTNIAAINYYFDSKETLYREAFEQLEALSEERYPLDGALQPEAKPEERLNAFIHAFLARVLDAQLGYLHCIRMAERFAPTGLLHDNFERCLARDRSHILSILREFLGDGAAERDILWCEMSVVGQCFIGLHEAKGDGPRAIFGIEPGDIDVLTEHILEFSLGGIRAMQSRLSHAANR